MMIFLISPFLSHVQEGLFLNISFLPLDLGKQLGVGLFARLNALSSDPPNFLPEIHWIFACSHVD